MTSRNEPAAEIKQSLRRDAARLRAAAHAIRRETAGEALTGRFLDAFSGRLAGKVVSLYWPIRDEIDVRALIDALSADGTQTALPVMAGPGAPLIFRAWGMGDVLVPGAFGVSQPSADAPVLVPDIIVAPLLAFDAAGNRLGYGGGYYDRTLHMMRTCHDVVAVGVGYDEQEFSSVPGDTDDEFLDMIITDRRTLRTGE